MDEIRNGIEEEWNKTEKRFPLNRLTKLYPLAESDSDLLDGPSTVDAAVVRLAKKHHLWMIQPHLKLLWMAE